MQYEVLDIYYVSTILFIYFTAFRNPRPLIKQIQTSKQFVHMSKSMFSQEI